MARCKNCKCGKTKDIDGCKSSEKNEKKNYETKPKPTNNTKDKIKK